MEKLVLENEYKIVMPYLVKHLLHQIRAQQFYTDLDLYQQCLILQKIEEFKDFEWVSITFQGRFNFQGLFKKAL